MRIKKEVLKRILELSKQAYPNEVAGILLNDPVDDFVLMPGKFSRNSVQVFLNAVPLYPNLYGSFHSHPLPSGIPSKADLEFFSKFGKEHLIIHYPYEFNCVSCYTSLGKSSFIELV